MNVYRIWGDYELPKELERGIIVASYQKLYSQREHLNLISDNGLLSGVFIDEAHHTVAVSYREILNGLEMTITSKGVVPPNFSSISFIPLYISVFLLK